MWRTRRSPTWTDATGNEQRYLDQPYRTPRTPYAFIQWKNTDVCMDVYCVCGDQFHIDGDFAHFTRCHHCGRVFQMDWYVRAKECDPAKAHISPKTDDDALEEQPGKEQHGQHPTQEGRGDQGCTQNPVLGMRPHRDASSVTCSEHNPTSETAGLRQTPSYGLPGWAAWIVRQQRP